MNDEDLLELEESIKEHERGDHSIITPDYWDSIREEFGLNE